MDTSLWWTALRWRSLQNVDFFSDAGLNVELAREPGWATIRDKVVYGELGAAHALAGLCFAVSWGVNVLKRPCVTGFLFNSHGDAITISNRLHEQGVHDAASLSEFIQAKRDRKTLIFGIPHLFSSHHFLLRQWFQPAGINPEKDIELVVLPPSLMVPSMESGQIDGFCVGEPFNSMAVVEKIGVLVKESPDISPMHPKKALMVTQEFSEIRSESHLALIRCLATASELCDTPDGREEVANILTRPEYLGVSRQIIRRSLFETDDWEHSQDFHLFNRFGVNEPSLEKANWIVSNIRSAGLLPDATENSDRTVSEVFRGDLYRKALLDNSAKTTVQKKQPLQPRIDPLLT